MWLLLDWFASAVRVHPVLASLLFLLRTPCNAFTHCPLSVAQTSTARATQPVRRALWFSGHSGQRWTAPKLGVRVNDSPCTLLGAWRVHAFPRDITLNKLRKQRELCLCVCFVA